MAQRPRSTVDPTGPLGRALRILAQQGDHDAVAEIRRLLVERLQYREEAARLREEVARLHQQQPTQ